MSVDEPRAWEPFTRQRRRLQIEEQGRRLEAEMGISYESGCAAAEAVLLVDEIPGLRYDHCELAEHNILTDDQRPTWLGWYETTDFMLEPGRPAYRDSHTGLLALELEQATEILHEAMADGLQPGLGALAFANTVERTGPPQQTIWGIPLVADEKVWPGVVEIRMHGKTLARVNVDLGFRALPGELLDADADTEAIYRGLQEARLWAELEPNELAVHPAVLEFQRQAPTTSQWTAMATLEQIAERYAVDEAYATAVDEALGVRTYSLEMTHRGPKAAELFQTMLGAPPRPWWKRLLGIDRPYTHTFGPIGYVEEVEETEHGLRARARLDRPPPPPVGLGIGETEHGLRAPKLVDPTYEHRGAGVWGPIALATVLVGLVVGLSQWIGWGIW